MKATKDMKALESILMAVANGFTYDPGHSDLDDEQPIHVTMTLGDYRKACSILQVSPYTKAVHIQ